MGVEIPVDVLRYLADLRMSYSSMEPCRWNKEYMVPDIVFIQTGSASGIKPGLGLDRCVLEEGPGVVRIKCKFIESTTTRDYEYSFDCLAIPSVGGYEAVYVLDAPQTKPAGKTLTVTLPGEAKVY